MVNLLEYKRETHNKDYFRAVRNDSSIAKRVGTYAVSSVIVGGLAGAIFLLPAVGPLVAAPTLLTALTYSGNLVLAGLAGGIGYSIHRSLLHKDNVLSKAERRIQKAAKIEKKFVDYENAEKEISDRKFARMIKTRDRKYMYFDTVHDMYHRKVDRLAAKLGYKLSDEYTKNREANPFVAETDPTKMKKVSNIEWLNNRRAKKLIKNFEKLDDLHEDYLDYLGIKGNDLTQVEEFSANLDERRIINRTKRGLSAIKNKIYSPESAAEREKKRQERENARKTPTPTVVAADTNSSTAKRTSKRTMNDFSIEDALRNDGTVAPEYTNVNDMSLFDQIVMSAQIVSSNKDRLNLVKYDEEKIESMQPRFAIAALSTKQGYMKALQRESVSNAPYPIMDKVTCDDACKYYKDSEPKNYRAMTCIKNELETMLKNSEQLEKYIDKQNLDTQGTEFLVQLDFDDPKYSINKKFDNAQKALAFSQLAECTASKLRKNNECDAYRITTWTKEAEKPYQASLNLSSVVVDNLTMKQATDRMYTAFLSETMNLHRTLSIVEDRKIKDSTVDIIKVINSYTGHTTDEREILASINKLPTLGLNTLIAEEIMLDDKTFSERDKLFRKEQLCRDSKVSVKA